MIQLLLLASDDAERCGMQEKKKQKKDPKGSCTNQRLPVSKSPFFYFSFRAVVRVLVLVSERLSAPAIKNQC